MLRCQSKGPARNFDSPYTHFGTVNGTKSAQPPISVFGPTPPSPRSADDVLYGWSNMS